MRTCRKRNLLHCGWERELPQLLWKTVWSFLRKITNTTITPSSKSTSGYLPEENENTEWKRYAPRVYCSVMYDGQGADAAGVPTDGRGQGSWCIDTMERYSAVKRNEILPFTTTRTTWRV